jgi:uncharacterized protein YpiB (UPF0302 family)
MSYDDYLYSINWSNPRVSEADSLNQQTHRTHDAIITQETRLAKAEWLLEEVKEYLEQRNDAAAKILLAKINEE